MSEGQKIVKIGLLFSALLITFTANAVLTPKKQIPLQSIQRFEKNEKAAIIAGTARTNRVFIAWKKTDDASGYSIYRDNVLLKKNVQPVMGSVIFPQNIASKVQIALGINSSDEFWSSGQVGSVDREVIRDILSQLYAEVAIVMGRGYFDQNADGKSHHYAVKKIVGGQELPYAEIDLAFKDYSKELQAPDANACKVVAGDQRLSLYWPLSSNPKVIAYDIEREGTPLNFLPVTAIFSPPGQKKGSNRTPKTSKLSELPNQPLEHRDPMHFFKDITVFKPKLFILKNGQIYHYKIIPRDLIGAGSQSTTVTGTPVDSLFPNSPNTLSFKVITTSWKYSDNSVPGCCAANCPLCEKIWKETLPDPNKEYLFNSGLQMTWLPVYFNTERFPEEVASYSLYRYTSVGDANQKVNGICLKTISIDPTQAQPSSFTVDDKEIPSGTVRWYRVAVSDKYNHTTYSNVYTAHYKDNTPPAAPTHVRLNTKTTNEKQVGILWDANQEPDLSGYLVYRRVCGIPNRFVRDRLVDDHFVLVGTLLKSETFFNDTTLPLNSPVCYEYCVKAFDKNQNVSLNTLGNVTCGRLKKTIGPSAPTITSLQSRGNAIRIDWVAPPVPDLYSFRVYRSENGKDWSKVSPNPAFPNEVRCQDTPPNGKDWVDGIVAPMKNGSVKNAYYMVDAYKIKPNTKYWYKVVSIDYFKNPQEGSNSENRSVSASMTTFTYEKYVKDTPELTAVGNPQKGVVLNWKLPPETANVSIIIYRSGKSATAGFHPIASGNFTTYTDNSIYPGKTYWYKIQFVTTSGHYSEYSKVVSVQAPDSED